ncbi:MAG: GH1 family beta-glucosidase [Myxococcota bacterium]
MREFPEDFVFGTSTSAFQVEGNTQADGRGDSIWDSFARRAGTISDGSDGSPACDHYRRWADDIDLMRRMGVDAYRFSMAWPRIFPNGRGALNEAGLDFYQRLVDGLLEADIEPMLTLYHWDLPQALQDRGGWPERDTGLAFADYAQLVSRRLGDRVKLWVTHNEPWCISVLGHELGEHAPGLQDVEASLRAAHNVLLSHGWATEAMRTEVPEDARLGIVLNLTPAHPASPSEADREEARRFDARFNRWFLDPLFRGQYPEDGVRDRRLSGELPEGPLPFVQEGDMSTIAVPTDFLGLNYYSRAILRSGALAEADNAPRELDPPSAETLTDMGWEVHPDGLEETLRRLADEYAPPAIYVTENGCAYAMGPDEEGRIRDEQRVEFLEGHLRAVARALEAEVPVAGYFVWSLLDNFEWAHGYTKRFGLAWVDYETQTRTLKDSGLRYAEIIASRGWEYES